jgi:site-specific DNA recombinase
MISSQQKPFIRNYAMKTLSKQMITKKAVIYARVSSKEQEKEGFSIPAQLKLLKNYAIQNNLSLIHEYIDIETAKKSGRGGFTEMVNFFRQEQKLTATNNPCRILLVEKTDRLYRNLKDWVTLDELDLEIHFAKENVVLSRDSRSSEKFMHGIKVLMAKNYIDNLSEETKKGMLEKAEQGIYPSCAPLGYINVECNGKRYIQEDPALGPVIRQLFEWYATGNFSLKQLVQKAFDDGLTYRKTGSKIPRSEIYKILKNSIYYGDFIWAGKMYRGIHRPIITKDLYDRVQDVLSEKGRRKVRQQKHEWAFQGLLTCGHCGCAITAEIKKDRYIYYHCTGYRGNCPEKYVREEEVARQFGEALRNIAIDEEVLGWIVTALKEGHTKEKEYHNEVICKLQDTYTKLQVRIDAMYEDKLDGRISQDYYDAKNRAWREEQQSLLAKIEKHQSANKSYLDEGIRILELSQQAVKLYEKQEMKERRKILNFLLSNSIWKNGQLIPSYRKPFDILVKTNHAYKKQIAASQKKSGYFDIWLPSADSNHGPGG